MPSSQRCGRGYNATIPRHHLFWQTKMVLWVHGMVMQGMVWYYTALLPTKEPSAD